MKNIFKLFVLSGLFLTYSCSTDLEEVLRGEITTDINIEGVSTGGGGGGGDALGGAFSQLQWSGTANHGNYYSLQGLTSDELLIAAKGGDWYDGGILIDLHDHTWTPTNGFLNNTWNGTYGGINACNEGLATDLDKNQKAQLRVLRALFYYRLLDLFGRVKIVTSPGTDAAQATRQQVYDFVESELLATLGISAVSASMDLSNSDLGLETNAYRVNRFAAMGLLSKLYLNAEVYTGTAKYTEAAQAAGYVIDSGIYQLCGAGCKVPNLGRRPAVTSDPKDLEGYAAVFAPNNEGNKEHIWSVMYDEVTNGGMNFAMMGLHYSSQFTWNFDSQPWNGYATLEEFYNSYESGDLRKANNFIVGPQLDFGGSAILDYASDDGNPILNYTPQINELAPNSYREAGARPGKFSFKQFGRGDMDNDYPLVRLGDLYLVRAEGLARAGSDWSLSLPDVNVIRARAGVSTMSSITADQFLAERGREMFQEATRRQDLIRFDKWGAAWWEKPVSQAYRKLFPIPFDAIQASGGSLTQNTGY